jgi:hypothetical protein
MEKVAVKNINVCKRKGKEDRQVKWVAKLGIAKEQTTRKTVEKYVKAKFITTWILIAVVEWVIVFTIIFKQVSEQIYASAWGWI